MLDDPCDDREEAELKSERSRRDAGGECLRLAPLFPTTVFYVCVENVMTYDEVGDSGSDCTWRDRGSLSLTEFREELKKKN